MTVNNTIIQIKHSTANDRPVSLNVGELAYSYKSNVLWIGTPDGINAFPIISNWDYGSGNTKWTTNSDTLPVGNLINFTSATSQGTINSNVGIKLTAASNSWTFNGNGNIVFPDGSVQTTAYSSLSSALDGIARITANAAFNKANSANVLAFNTGVGANAYAANVGSSTNTYIRAIIAGANTTVGAGANAYTNTTTTSANAFFLSVIAGANVVTNAAFDKANAALANTSDVSFAGNLNFPVGNVTIGTTGTSYGLTVNGNVTATGSITANSGNINSLVTSNIGFTNSTSRITTTTGVDGWSYSGAVFSVSGQETEPRDLSFSSDGTIMYILGNVGDDITVYNLSTPWDITTATGGTTTFSVTTQETVPTGLTFKPDGTSFYVVGSNTDTVYQYDMTTPWDVTTASYSTKSFSVAARDGVPEAIEFSSDGTKMFIVGSTNDSVYQFDLGTAWDITTAVFNTSLSVVTYDATPQGIAFNSDGTKMYVMGQAVSRLQEYTLATPWNLATATFTQFSVISNLGTALTLGCSGIYVNLTQSKAYITDYQNDAVFQLNTGNPATKIVGPKLVVQPETLFQSEVVFDKNTRYNGEVRAIGAVTGGSFVTVGTTSLGGAVTLSSTTSAINIGTSLTTGLFNLGGTLQTSGIQIGRSTTTQTVSIANGATSAGNTKRVDIATDGLTNSTTNVTIGSATSNTTIILNGNLRLSPSNGNVGIGTTNAQYKLDVNGAVNIASTLIVGGSNIVSAVTFANTIANAAYAQANSVQTIANLAFDAANAAFAKANTGTGGGGGAANTTFTSNVVISVADSTNAALRITQTGTSPAILVEDEVNPDSTPFVVDANGSVGIGTINPQYKLDVNGSVNIASTLIVGGANIANSIAFANTTAIAAFEKANTGSAGSLSPLTVSEYSFTGDGSTTVYTLGSGAKTNNTLVIVNGVVQPNAAYTLNDSSSTVTMSEAPALNDRVFFKIVTGNTATISTTDNTIVNSAYNKANDANILAFSSFVKANDVQTIANASFDFANTVNVISYASFAQANVVNVAANAAFTRANAAQTIAIAAFAQANISASGNTTVIMSNVANAMSGTSLYAVSTGTVLSTGSFANYGDAVVKEYILRGTSTSATEIELLINGSGRIPIPLNTTVFYTVDFAVRRTDVSGYSAAFFLKGVADNFGGSVADVGSLYEVVVARDALTYTVDARASDATDTINIYATGTAGHTVRWVAHVKTVEVAQ